MSKRQSAVEGTHQSAVIVVACPCQTPRNCSRLAGARSVAAADTDSLAVRATTGNAEVSGFQDQLTVALGSVETLADLLAGEPADLLLCNILAPVIEALCPAFTSVLAPSGLGLLSGLLVDQAPRLQAVLAEQGWRAELTAQQSQWGLMTLRRADVA